MFNLRIHLGAGINTVKIETDTGRQTIDRKNTSRSHCNMIRMLIVNSYCEHVGRKPTYHNVAEV